MWVKGLCILGVISAYGGSASAMDAEVSGRGQQNQYSESKESMKIPVESNEFKFMTYNVLNLFDNQHDIGKKDWTFLALDYPGKSIKCQELASDFYRKECLSTNWTDDKIRLKLNQIKQVVSLQGSLPELLALQEVENENVVGQLRDVLGYSNMVMTNSPDERGIDVALLYNQEVLEYVDHEEIDVSAILKQDYNLSVKTRNILRVHFRPKNRPSGRIIGVYVNHWPSQGKGSVFRYSVAKILQKAIDNQTEKLGASQYFVIVTGDFNTLDPETPNAFHHVVTNPLWNNHLYDVKHLSDYAHNPMRFKMPPGTYWYSREGVFNRFDRFFVSKNLQSPESIQVLPRSYRVVGTRSNSRLYQYRGRSADYYPLSQWVPKRYDFNTTSTEKAGYSDHYPVVVKFKIDPR